MLLNATKITGPTLPPRFLLMVANGMARIFINMKEAEMAPATWDVCYSFLRVSALTGRLVALSNVVRQSVGLDECWPCCCPRALCPLQPAEVLRIQKYKFEKDRRLALGSTLLQRAVIHWSFSVSYPDIVILRTGQYRCLSSGDVVRDGLYPNPPRLGYALIF